MDLWFDHLDDKVGRPSSRYSRVMKALYQTQFEVVLERDDNRVADCIAARDHFLKRRSMAPISVLEVMIELTNELSFLEDGSPAEWFWELFQNLGLDRFPDAGWRAYDSRGVDEIIRRVNRRTYKPSGHGGLFPLSNPTEDQRDVELWYQLNAWLIERD